MDLGPRQADTSPTFSADPSSFSSSQQAATGGAFEECVHFWLIESPNGPTSLGVCKLCGRTQAFRNSLTTSTWNKGLLRRADDWRNLV